MIIGWSYQRCTVGILLVSEERCCKKKTSFYPWLLRAGPRSGLHFFGGEIGHRPGRGLGLGLGLAAERRPGPFEADAKPKKLCLAIPTNALCIRVRA